MPEVAVPVEYVVNSETGLIEPALQRPSPNFDARPDATDPDCIILHGISLPPGEFGGGQIESLFLNQLDWDEHPYFAEIRGLEVSAHLLIRRDGELLQFVSFNERAWHAGESCLLGRKRCNDYSIGIELEGQDSEPYTPRQYDRLAEIIGLLLKVFPGLSRRNIVGHCDTSPGRNTDPGPAFDWLALYERLDTVPT